MCKLRLRIRKLFKVTLDSQPCEYHLRLSTSDGLGGSTFDYNFNFSLLTKSYLLQVIPMAQIYHRFHYNIADYNRHSTTSAECRKTTPLSIIWHTLHRFQSRIYDEYFCCTLLFPRVPLLFIKLFCPYHYILYEFLKLLTGG